VAGCCRVADLDAAGLAQVLMTAGKMEVRRLGLHLFSCPTRCGISGDHVRCQRRREQSRQRSSSVRRRLHEGQATGKGYGGPDVVCAGAGLATWSSRRVRDERTTWSRSPTCFYSSLYSPDGDWRRGSRLRPLGKHCLDRRASGPLAGTSPKTKNMPDVCGQRDAAGIRRELVAYINTQRWRIWSKRRKEVFSCSPLTTSLPQSELGLLHCMH